MYFFTRIKRNNKNKSKIAIYPIDSEKWNDVGQWETLKLTEETFKKI